MSVYQVRHSSTEAILWTGEASTEARALDVMACEAGFRSKAELPDSIKRGGLIVEAMSFEKGRPATGRAAERVTGGVPLERSDTASLVRSGRA